MVAICEKLEDEGRSGELGRAPMLVGRLEAELARVRGALKTELADK